MNGWGWVLALGVLVAAPSASAQAPEDRGTFAVEEWDAGRVAVAGTTLPTLVVYPGGAGPFPVVGVIHGASRNGSYHVELARTLASRGFVAVVPDMPCAVTSCDHDANAMQISALLAWAVARSADASSPIAGKIDGERRGLIGHSWGALASHLVASRDPSIDSVVLFDPNDDGTVGRDATASITAPELQLLAEVPGGCNSQWDEAMVSPMLPPPHLQLTVDGSAHCDPEEPGDVFCPFACGSGDPSTSSVFRRYAIAWTACILAGDASMASWLDGASFASDVSAGTITNVVSDGLAALPCHGVIGVDAGIASDAAIAADAGAALDAAASDGGGSAIDGATAMDGGLRDRDAGAPGTGGDGCGCSAPGERARDPGALAASIAVALAITIARRR